VDLGNEKLPGIAPVPRYLMISRAIPDAQVLVEASNKGFAELAANGTAKRLLLKYLGSLE
jgi:ABC-type amino acid transport substrate-binding protein